MHSNSVPRGFPGLPWKKVNFFIWLNRKDIDLELFIAELLDYEQTILKFSNSMTFHCKLSISFCHGPLIILLPLIVFHFLHHGNLSGAELSLPSLLPFEGMILQFRYCWSQGQDGCSAKSEYFSTVKNKTDAFWHQQHLHCLSKEELFQPFTYSLNLFWIRSCTRIDWKAKANEIRQLRDTLFKNFEFWY